MGRGRKKKTKRKGLDRARISWRENVASRPLGLDADQVCRKEVPRWRNMGGRTDVGDKGDTRRQSL